MNDMEHSKQYEVAIWQRFQASMPDMPCLNNVQAFSPLEAVFLALVLCGITQITHVALVCERGTIERWRMGRDFWVRL